MAETQSGGTTVTYHRTRQGAYDHLVARFDAALREKRSVVAGFDFPFGYPRGFAKAVTGTSDPFALWEYLAHSVEDGPNNANNRFEVAERLNRLFPGTGPFWGCPPARATDDLPMRGSDRHGHGQLERREVETKLKRAQACWKLFTAGSVGSQVLLGLPRLQALREHFGEAIAVRPFENRNAPILLAEIYPSLIDQTVRARQGDGEILDAAQVRVLAEAFAGLPPETLDRLLRDGDPEEGWIAGLGYEAALSNALASGRH